MPTRSERHLHVQPAPRIEGFLAAHRSPETVVSIGVEPETVYFEESHDSLHLSFDFSLTGLTERILDLVFLKVAAYDENDRLITYRYVNRNAVGVPGIQTLGTTRIEAMASLHLFNPFHTFLGSLEIDHLRYMFTFRDAETAEEFYYGDVVIAPSTYEQLVELEIPVRGLVTVLDGHDYFSHHRRFDTSITRTVTHGAMRSNFSRYALDFVHIGDDGNTRRIPSDELTANYDFRFVDARRFYSDMAPVFAPADGEVVVKVDGKPDHYDKPFDSDAALAEGRVTDLAGNYVAIRHNDREFSHLFHFREGSIDVDLGQHVARGERLGCIGFSGAATVYSHLHYQLMDGSDFLTAQALPARFRRITFLYGAVRRTSVNVAIDTGDIIWAE